MYGVDRWLGWTCKGNLADDDPEVVDVVGDEGSGMLGGEFKGAASFVDLIPPLCGMRLDVANLRYDS
jgi:hypothetical protein